MKLKSKLTETEKEKVKTILANLIDFYAEFYLTQARTRLFIKENLEILFEELDKGDKIVYTDSGVLVVNGFSDDWDRKYVKILCDDLKTGDKLLKSLEELKTDLFIKIKRTNPLKEVLEKNEFKIFKNRGKEFLMIRKINTSKEKNPKKDKEK